MKRYFHPSIELLLTLPNGSLFYATVTSNSMYPTMAAGDVVQVSKEPIHSLSLGDIILFVDVIHEQIVVHRVRQIHKKNKQSFLITKGDNAPQNDRVKINTRTYIGKVTQIRKTLRGYINKFLLKIGM